MGKAHVAPSTAPIDKQIAAIALICDPPVVTRKPTAVIAALLGHIDEPELIQRDNMVVG